MQNAMGTSGGSATGLNTVDNHPGLMTAKVTLKSTDGSQASGTITLNVTANGLQVSGNLTGLTPGTTYMPMIRFGDVGADAGNGWTLPSVQADASGNATLSATVAGIVAIPEDGWYFRLDTAGKPVAAGVIGQTLPSTTAVATYATSSYLISLQIGPLGKMITPAQAAAGMSGDIMPPMSGMKMPMMSMMFDGEPANHHLEAHIFNRLTGAVETNLMPMITVANSSTHTTSKVQSVVMYGSDVGIPDYHYGNDVFLPGSTYLSLTLSRSRMCHTFRFGMLSRR